MIARRCGAPRRTRRRRVVVVDTRLHRPSRSRRCAGGLAPTDESTPERPRAPSHRASARLDRAGSLACGGPPSGDLRAEIDLIDAARAALRAGDTSQALDLLGRHAVHFPHGALAPEETALRVEALMRLGRTSEARAYARRFVAANPASPLAERMRRLVNDAKAP